VGYFVDIPKPKAWPPPRDGDESANKRTRELLDYGVKRDPIGDKFHTAFACFFMFVLPIDTYPTTIATFILFIYSVMRLPSTWRTLIPISNSTIFRLVFAWTAWSLLSITWSSNQAAGLDHAGAMRMVLLPLALWPVMRHWKYFLGAFLLGVLFQNFVQLSEVVGSWFLNGNDYVTGGKLGSISGIEKHSGKAALFMGFASLSWLGIIFCKCKYRKTATGCLLLATTGMFATVSMAVAIGFIFALFVLCVFAIKNKRIAPKTILYSVSSLLIIVSLGWFTVGGRITAKTESAIQGVQDFYEGNIQGGNSTIMRLHWWSKTLSQSFDEPAVVHGIFGHGLGSVTTIDFSEDGSSMLTTADHLHNSYIQLLYEEGIVGLLLLLFIFWKMIQKSKKLISEFNWFINPICVAGTLFWATITFFENSQSSGRPLAMLFLLSTFIMYNSCYVLGEKQA
jgi:O-antigen ligase